MISVWDGLLIPLLLLLILLLLRVSDVVVAVSCFKRKLSAGLDRVCAGEFPIWSSCLIGGLSCSDFSLDGDADFRISCEWKSSVWVVINIIGLVWQSWSSCDGPTWSWVELTWSWGGLARRLCLCLCCCRCLLCWLCNFCRLAWFFSPLLAAIDCSACLVVAISFVISPNFGLLLRLLVVIEVVVVVVVVVFCLGVDMDFSLTLMMRNWRHVFNLLFDADEESLCRLCCRCCCWNGGSKWFVSYS